MPTVEESMIPSVRHWMTSSESAWALVRPWCQMREQNSRIGLISRSVGVGVIEDLTFFWAWMRRRTRRTVRQQLTSCQTRCTLAAAMQMMAGSFCWDRDGSRRECSRSQRTGPTCVAGNWQHAFTQYSSQYLDIDTSVEKLKVLWSYRFLDIRIFRFSAQKVQWYIGILRLFIVSA